MTLSRLGGSCCELDSSQNAFAFGLGQTFNNIFISSSSMVGKCDTKQFSVEPTILQLDWHHADPANYLSY